MLLDLPTSASPRKNLWAEEKMQTEVQTKNLELVKKICEMFEPFASVRTWLGCFDGMFFSTPEIHFSCTFSPGLDHQGLFFDQGIVGKTSRFAEIAFPEVTLYLSRNGGWICTAENFWVKTQQMRRATPQEVEDILSRADGYLAAYNLANSLETVLEKFVQKEIGFTYLKRVTALLEELK